VNELHVRSWKQSNSANSAQLEKIFARSKTIEFEIDKGNKKG